MRDEDGAFTAEAVQYKLLHSLGHFVSHLEPPSRLGPWDLEVVGKGGAMDLDPSTIRV